MVELFLQLPCPNQLVGQCSNFHFSPRAIQVAARCIVRVHSQRKLSDRTSRVSLNIAHHVPSASKPVPGQSFVSVNSSDPDVETEIVQGLPDMPGITRLDFYGIADNYPVHPGHHCPRSIIFFAVFGTLLP